MTVRKLVWPLAFALVGFCVMFSLGLWQLNRKAWKEQLIAQVEARAKAAPIALRDIPKAWREAPDQEDSNFARVAATGRFDHARELHLLTPERDGAAWMVITPFETPEGTALVMRGVVPDRLKDPARRAQGQIEGDVAIVGRIRLPEQAGSFTPANDVNRNAWFWRDLAGMQRAARVDEASRALPFFIELESPTPPGGIPRPKLDQINLRNDHLQYAITWFALAGVMVVMFGVWVRAQRGRPAS